jgi:hypothetical protein
MWFNSCATGWARGICRARGVGWDQHGSPHDVLVRVPLRGREVFAQFVGTTDTHFVVYAAVPIRSRRKWPTSAIASLGWKRREVPLNARKGIDVTLERPCAGRGGPVADPNV